MSLLLLLVGADGGAAPAIPTHGGPKRSSSMGQGQLIYDEPETEEDDEWLLWWGLE